MHHVNNIQGDTEQIDFRLLLGEGKKTWTFLTFCTDDDVGKEIIQFTSSFFVSSFTISTKILSEITSTYKKSHGAADTPW